MMPKHCKIKAYIGFAIKSRSIKYGVDEILKLKKSSLILLSDELANSSKDKVDNFAKKKNCEIIELPSNEFVELFDGNTNIKAVAVTDENLAKAIKKNMTEN